LNIALINHEFPPIASGVASYVYDLANSLAKKVNVTVITGSYANGDLIEHRDDNFHVYRLSTPDIAPRFVWFQLKNRKKIKEILEKNEIDILHGQGTSCAFLLSDGVFRRPKIVTHHGDPKQDILQLYKSPFRYKVSNEFLQYGVAYPLWYFLSKHEYAKANRVITFSKFIATNLQRTFGLKKEVTVLPQGIDLQKILSIIDRGSTVDDNSIFFSGRLIWRKGVVFLLKAFEKVHKVIPDLKLKIFGEGPLNGLIQNFVKRRNLEEHILCYGYVSYSNLLREICKSYFGVLPSLFEAASIMMLELMACKKPLVAFNLPFLSEQFKHGYNAYLTSMNQKELARAIIELYYDSSLRERIANTAYEYVATYHNWSKLVDEYLRIYENLCA
jgi:glycosyltransferase involved in cell wall biosynthesis